MRALLTLWCWGCFVVSGTAFSLGIASNGRRGAWQRRYMSTTDTNAVRVYDNVFSPQVCQDLHRLAVDHCGRGNDGSSYFVRGSTTTRLTPLEQALDSVLESINDENDIVEYWSRQECINIDVHADLDEDQLEKGQGIRCPQWGHVLYLYIQPNRKGPTCVFPHQQNSWDGEDRPVDLVTVPAVQGRVLRFPGGAMHAVPQPPNRWFLDSAEESQLRRWENDSACGGEGDEEDNEEEEEEDYEMMGRDEHELGDEEDNEDDEDLDMAYSERSVILFNTWSSSKNNGDGASGAPWGVIPDPIVSSLQVPEGVDIDEEDFEAFLSEQKEEQWMDWEDDYASDDDGSMFSKVLCKPRNEWAERAIASSPNNNEGDNQEEQLLNVYLLGKENRHRREDSVVHLGAAFPGSSSRIQDALLEDTKPSRFSLKEMHP